MTTRIDRFGRVLIPKGARDALGLKPGDDLEVVAQNGRIGLVPERKRGGLTRKNGFLLWDGELTEPVDLVEFINRQRDERTDEVMGRVQP